MPDPPATAARCEAGRRWRRPPRRVRCELPEGHDGEHMNGLDVWESVEQIARRIAGVEHRDQPRNA